MKLSACNAERVRSRGCPCSSDGAIKMPSLPSASLPEEKRDELLGKIRDGHDLESACTALGITDDQIAAGGDELKTAISGAFRAGTARLRGKIMEGALSSDNVGILMKLLE